MEKKFAIIITSLVVLAFFCNLDVKADNVNSIQPQQYYVDELDQYQNTAIEGIGLIVGRMKMNETISLNFQAAQSFIPQKSILTRVELFIGKNMTAFHPFNLGIRDELTASDLISVSAEPEIITTENFSWIEFDCSDMWVTIGQTYYLVGYTENDTDNWYGWAGNNVSTSYPHGCAWMSINDGLNWSNDSVCLDVHNTQQHNLRDDNTTWDMVFRTYGLDATELSIEMKPGILKSTVEIKNVGSVPAYDVVATLDATGGIFNRINTTLSTNTSELSDNTSISIILGPIFGFGPINIHVEAIAANAEEVSLDVSGFIFFIFQLIS